MIKFYLLATLASLTALYFADRAATKARKPKTFHELAQAAVIWIAAIIQIISVFFFMFYFYQILKNLF